MFELLVTHLRMSKSIVYHLIRHDKLIKPHSNAIKPHLKDENKVSHVQYCLLHLDQVEELEFMMNKIHLDEKWFSFSKNMRQFYIVNEEEEPHCIAKSNLFMMKVMFLAVVVQPQSVWYMFESSLWRQNPPRANTM